MGNDIPIVVNIFWLNILIISTLVCGIISGILFYFQIDQGNGILPLLRDLKLLPLGLSTALFRLLSIAITFLFLNWFAFLVYVSIYIIFLILWYIPDTNYVLTVFPPSIFTIMDMPISGRRGTKNMRIRHKQFHINFWFILNSS